MPFQKGNELWKLRDNTKHGMSHTRLYTCWASMKARCNYESNPFYQRYGGRGITYCEEWENFEPFMRWALANGYSDSLTLDRIDNDGNYSQDNCRWATQQQQALNKKHLSNKTGFTGVRACYRKNPRTGERKLIGYRATVCRNMKEHYCGFSKTAKGAFEKRQKFIEEHYADTL